MSRARTLLRHAGAVIGLAALAISALAISACKAGAGERCICADDCKDGLVCLAGGSVLRGDDCSPAVGEDADPGMCVDASAAGEGEDMFPEPEIYLDLGSKRDFEPGAPEVPTSSGSGTASGSAGDTTASTAGATATGSSGSGSGSSGSSGSGSGSSGSGSSGSGSSSSGTSSGTSSGG